MTDQKRPFTKATVALDQEALKLTKNMKVGGRLRVVLYGTLKELHQGSEDISETGADNGSIVMNVSNMRLASNNEIAELFDDEFDE